MSESGEAGLLQKAGRTVRNVIAGGAIIAGGGAAVDNATGGHGADFARQTISAGLNAGENAVNNLNPNPYFGKEVQEGVISTISVDPLPEEGGNLPPVFRTSPKVDIHNELTPEKLAELGINIKPGTILTGKEKWGGTFPSQGHGAFQKNENGEWVEAKRDGEGHYTLPGPAVGKWFEIELKAKDGNPVLDKDGNPVNVYLAKNFATVQAQTSSVTSSAQSGK